MKYKILLVEDDPKQSKPFIQMLQYRNYEVFHAYNGLDAISQALEVMPDLIIVDLRLDKRGDQLDGYELIQTLRNTPEVKNIAIMVWTAEGVDSKDEVRALRNGADDYVVKKNDIGTIEARIEALIRRVKRLEN